MTRLRVMTTRDEGLGQPTIMQKDLALRHGTPYIHLAVVAIDLDRVHEATEWDERFGFGWEVSLTAAYLIQALDPANPQHVGLVEDACLAVMDQSDETAALGTQLPFAAYVLVQKNFWPDAWPVLFASWRSPRKLIQALGDDWNDTARLSGLAAACLQLQLSPPLAAPTQQFLQALLISPEE